MFGAVLDPAPFLFEQWWLFFGRQNLMVVSFSSFKVSQHMSTYPLFGSISFDDFSSFFFLHLWEISLLCFLVDEIYESIFRVNKLPCPTVIPHPITEDRLFQVLRESSTRFTSIDEAALPWNITWYKPIESHLSSVQNISNPLMVDCWRGFY